MFNVKEPQKNSLFQENAENEKILEVTDLRKIYKMGAERVLALNRVNFSIHKDEIVCITGTSGSGKSTLLNMLAGMERPSYGSIKILGRELTRMPEYELAAFRQQHIGFIFQSYNLLPSYSAVENVALPLVFRGISKKTREKVARMLLHKVGLGDRLEHYPSQMSGGQQQRVGIARAFVTRPQIIFADEPTGNLDTKTTEEILDMISNIASEFHQTIILVTHDMEMTKYATRTITMKDGNIITDSANHEE